MANRPSRKIIVFGTRPEFIKLLPLFSLIEERELNQQFIIIHTGQHQEVLNEKIIPFGVKPDYSISFKDHKNSVLKCYNHISKKLDEIIQDIKESYVIDCIMGQGDTTSCCCAAFVAFLNRIPFAHIEAGLRTYNNANPFPEEYFRKIISLSAEIHFAPTQHAYNNLIKENIDPRKIVLSGNTIIDAIKLFKSEQPSPSAQSLFNKHNKNVLITCHRRENQNDVIDQLLEKVEALALNNPEINFIWIEHPNPIVRKKIARIATKASSNNMHLIPPVSYQDMIQFLSLTSLIVSDSGGLQEEAAYFGIPIIVVRDFTERIESIDKNIAFLQKSDFKDFEHLFEASISNPIAKHQELYGDGKASERILNQLLHMN